MVTSSDRIPGTEIFRRSVAERLDGAIGGAVQAVSAILVVAEIVILFCGILARYVFHRPLVWSDELASLLFVWLAMFGSVLAFRANEHMRMTALVTKAPPAARRFLEMIALYSAMAFLLVILLPSIAYVQDEAIVVMPALDVSQSWRTAAMPLGVVLMIVTGLLRGGDPRRSEALLALGVVAAACLAMFLLQPVLIGLGRINLVIFFLGIVSLTVFAGVPIAFSFGLGTLGYLALSTHIPLSVLVARMDAGMSHFILLSVPLFVFLGLLIEMTGMARVMVRFLANLLGHVRGGLSYVLIAAMYLVSGISGSKAADMAAVAPVLFPEMEARGATRGDLVALLAATGAQTETIPPSLILITIGSVTGVSIAALFTGGLLPGLVVGLILCSVVWYRSRSEDLGTLRRAPAAVLLRSFLIALPALGLPFVIRGAVVEGVATATEVSTIGIVYSVIAGLLIYRQFDWSRLMPMLVQTAALSGAILLIVGAATAMAWAVTQSGFSRGLAESIAGAPGGAASFLAISAVLFVILGSVLEGIPAIVLFGPLLFPIAKQVGVHEVHFAMVAILAMGVGLFAPPFGVGYYVACAIGRCNPDEGMRHIGRYLLALIVGLVIVAAVPWISTGFL
jgi:tripartite ATP-independent transporter DctM subunit